jgi:hypothetical protein
MTIQSIKWLNLGVNGKMPLAIVVLLGDKTDWFVAFVERAVCACSLSGSIKNG